MKNWWFYLAICPPLCLSLEGAFRIPICCSYFRFKDKEIIQSQHTVKYLDQCNQSSVLRMLLPLKRRHNLTLITYWKVHRGTIWRLYTLMFDQDCLKQDISAFVNIALWENVILNRLCQYAVQFAKLASVYWPLSTCWLPQCFYFLSYLWFNFIYWPVLFVIHCAPGLC